MKRQSIYTRILVSGLAAEISAKIEPKSKARRKIEDRKLRFLRYRSVGVTLGSNKAMRLTFWFRQGRGHGKTHKIAGYQLPSRLSPIQDGTKTKWWLVRIVWKNLHRRVARRLDSAFAGVSKKTAWELHAEGVLLSCVLHRAMQINEGKGTHVTRHTIHCNQRGIRHASCQVTPYTATKKGRKL